MIFLKELFDSSTTSLFPNNLTSQGLWGIEREQLRIETDGILSLHPSPPVLHQEQEEGFFTTDFAESQLEIVTHPQKGIGNALGALEKLLIQAHSHLPQNETLWPASLPGSLPPYQTIPLACSGQENPQEAQEYRLGLLRRYSFFKMLISGIHINISFPEETTNPQTYPDAARRFLRDRWLLIWLFGSSPVVPPDYKMEMEQCVPSPWMEGRCIGKSFFRENFPYATSLRMSCFGSPPQPSSIEGIPFTNLESYTKGLDDLLKTGQSSGLSKESELYLPIRLKTLPQKGESLTAALKKRGADYLEIRTVDVNPLLPLGIDPDEMSLQYLILKTGLSRPLRPDTREDRLLWNKNHHTAALFGRKEGVTLLKESGESIPLQSAAHDVLNELEETAKGLTRNAPFREALERARAKADNPDFLPSAQICRETGKNGENYIPFVLEKAKEYHTYFINQEHKNEGERTGTVHQTDNPGGKEPRPSSRNIGSTSEFHQADRLRQNRAHQRSDKDLPGQLYHVFGHGK